MYTLGVGGCVTWSMRIENFHVNKSLFTPTAQKPLPEMSRHAPSSVFEDQGQAKLLTMGSTLTSLQTSVSKPAVKSHCGEWKATLGTCSTVSYLLSLSAFTS